MKMKVFAKLITTELASITLACLCLGGDRCAGRAGLHKPRAIFCRQSKKRRSLSLSGLAAQVQELHGSEVCLTKLEVFFDKYGTSTAHMCETSAKYVISHL